VNGPLDGSRVIEIGSLIAAPFAGRLLAEFGAEVIKIEAPNDGDPLRRWRMMHGGTSLWWYLQSRNKKSVCVDLKSPGGVAVVKRLTRDADILIENLRPGALERLGLGWEVLHELNPDLTMVRISGYGQSGPYRDRPGFGSIGEAMGGIRYTTGEADGVPARAGISLGDSLASLHGVIGALLSLLWVKTGRGRGQVVDVVLETLDAAEVPASRIYSVADIVADPHYHARQMLLRAELPDGTPVRMPGIVPKLSQTPGVVRWIGPKLGEHTAEVLAGLGFGEEQVEQLSGGAVK
jgi:crotonobetainyl-CoA:carnitine CoA-transferase CaiB-like acyl-CoA transferase